MKTVKITKEELLEKFGDVELHFTFLSSFDIYFDGEIDTFGDTYKVSVRCGGTPEDIRKMHFGRVAKLKLNSLDFNEVHIINDSRAKLFIYKDPNDPRCW